MPEQPEDTFFAELNAEIAEATAKSNLKADAAKLKRQSLNMRLDARTRQRYAEDYKAVQAIVEANQWQQIMSSAMFTEQCCDGCGSVHYNFLQYMVKEEKLTNRSHIRWTRVPLPPKGLPRQTVIQPLKTHICVDCATDHEFNPNAPDIRLMPIEGAVTVSATYLSGDINETNV